MTTIQNKSIKSSSSIAENFKLPKLLNNKPAQAISFSSFGLYSKNDIDNRIQNDLIPNNLETFCESTKDCLKNEADMKKCELIQLKNGRYVFKNEHGILMNKHGPFWPKMCKIFHTLPQFIQTSNKVEPYLNKEEEHKIHLSNIYVCEWKNNLLIFDVEKSPRNQEPLIFSHIYSPTLLFESRFESGNLRQARRRGQFEYDLILNNDVNTDRHTQWYFFQVKNMVPHVTYRFRILNLKKRYSLYNEGLQPLVYSEKTAMLSKVGWYRSGHHIDYIENTTHRLHIPGNSDVTYYELDFQIEFPYEKDVCYLAHCYPYTFSNLKDEIDCLEYECQNKRIFQRDFLCETRAGNTCFLLTITDFNESDGNKMVVLISARVHPGETNSSYMMKGILKYLTSEERIAQELRKKFIFKIIPMLNPDGVIVGNYRCALAGKDMNRNYRNPRKGLFPVVWHLKDLVNDLKQHYEIFGYYDLHGHSRKSNMFSYGCIDSNQPETELPARVFPWIFSKKAPHAYSFDSSRFKVRRAKESTCRVVMWREFNIKHSYTIEISFAGTNKCEKPYHYSIDDYLELGKLFCHSIHEQAEALQNKSILESIYLEITKYLVENFNQNAEVEKDNEENRDNCESNTDKQSENSEPLEIDDEFKTENDCFDALRKYNEKLCYESESTSESDSDSEPEIAAVVPPKPKKIETKPSQTQAFEKKSSSQSKKKFVYTYDALPSSPAKPRANSFRKSVDRANSTSLLTSAANKTPDKRITTSSSVLQVNVTHEQSKKKSASYSNKYSNRTSDGIPKFTLERAEERMLQKQKKLEEKNSLKLLKEIDSSNTDEIRTIDDNFDEDLNDNDESIAYHEGRAQNGDSKISQLTVVSFGSTPIQKFDFESLGAEKQSKLNAIGLYKNDPARLIRNTLQRSNSFNTSRGFFRGQNVSFDKEPFLFIRKSMTPKAGAYGSQNSEKKIHNDMRAINYKSNQLLQDFRAKQIEPCSNNFVNFLISNSAPKN